MKTQNQKEFIHWKAVSNNPYMASTDIVGQVVLTISHVTQEADKTKRTQEVFNTAWFIEAELDGGVKVKPMILNTGNSLVLQRRTGSKNILDWVGIPVTVYVQNDVRHGRDLVDGLRLADEPPLTQPPELLPSMTRKWNNAIKAYQRDGNLDAVMKRCYISPANQQMIVDQAGQK